MATQKWKRKKRDVKKWNEEEKLLARKMSTMYRLQLKGKNVHVRPWRSSIPIEDQPDVFIHFLKAAEIVREEEIDWKEFVRAQFEKWNGPPSASPLPSQLHSAQSLTRYSEWKLADSINADLFRDSIEQRRKDGRDIFVNDRHTLKSYKIRAHSDKTDREILLMFFADFSREYHQKRGTWKKVRREWISYRECDD